MEPRRPVRGGMTIGWRGVAAMTSLLLTVTGVLTACSYTPTVPELTGVRTVAVASMIATIESPDGMQVRDAYDADGIHERLSGPHFTLGISWVATGQELDARTAQRFAIEPVRAAPGEQLTLVLVSPDATNAAFKPDTGGSAGRAARPAP
jgi:hypothetical protein